MIDFYEAGGVPAVMKELKPLLNLDELTCTGKTVGENLLNTTNRNKEIIHELKNPFRSTGGIMIVRGNLAPRGGVAKPSAVLPSMLKHRGPAQVFNGEAETLDAIEAGQISSGSVVVIRYEGPRGGPGMPEMYKPMKLLEAYGLSESVALVSDGRFSGGNRGPFVGHICPEAADSGPIALVKNEDMISLDLRQGIISLEVSDSELSQRMKSWSPPEPRVDRGYLSLYSRIVSPADQGAIVR